MECENCKAYGKDNLGFKGCLVRNSMLDLPNGKVGCKKHGDTIDRMIDSVKKYEPREPYYKWINMETTENKE